MQKDFATAIFVPCLILTAALLSGCVAATAGAAMSEAGSTPDRENIEYVRNHDLEPYIGRAIEREQIVRGMTPEHVRFLKGEPKEIREEGDKETWTYGPVSQRKYVVFEKGKVANIK
jgi:outer membrane protein assembly factor BamE (lipoprotein component of BamABCDE complex)